MASSTTNLDLILPVGGENVSRQIINANNVKIDEAVGAVPSGTDLQSQVTALNNNITNVNNKITSFVTLSSNNYNTLSDACQAFISAMGDNKHSVGDLGYNSFRYIVDCYKYSDSWATMSLFGYSGASYHCWKENGTWQTTELAKLWNKPVTLLAGTNITINSQSAYITAGIMFVFMRWTASASISAYSAVASFTGYTSKMAWNTPLMTDGNIPTSSSTALYADAGNNTIRASNTIPAGTYRSYIIIPIA